MGDCQLMTTHGSSAGKESGCNAGDSESGRSTGEGIDYQLRCSWASLVAQMVKNLLTMQETWVQSLNWEDLLEKGMATQIQYSGLENSMDRAAWWARVHGAAEGQTRLSTEHNPGIF